MKNISEILQEIEKEIAKINFGDHPSNLFDPMSYIMSLGGKRLRPTLGCLSYQINSGKPISNVRPMLALEIFHNFTLMHDDIMDKAPIRRGKLTVHEKWDETVAILSGDTMLVIAYDFLLESETAELSRLISRFNRTAVEVCMGQQIDMNFETTNTVSEEDYIEMIRLKTAVLLGFSMEMGAILASADSDTSTRMFSIGESMGVGFQLMDDFLDVYADASKFGKQVGGDIISNKKTYLLINALKKATGSQKQELDSWLTMTDFDSVEKVQTVTEIYNDLGIPEMTKEKIDFYFDKGISDLHSLDVDAEARNLMISYAEKLLNRDR